MRKTATILLASAALGVAVTAAAPAQAGSAPVLAWTPATGTATYDYGTIDASGTDPVQTFTLTNSGRAGTSALKITVTGSSAYTITGNTCAGTSLGPKKTCTVTVQYAPTAAGQTDTATLTATSNKPAARATHTLTGSATNPVTNIQYRMYEQSLFGFRSHGYFDVRECKNDVIWTGLQPSTEYYYRATFGDGHVWNFSHVSSTWGEESVTFVEDEGSTWTIQAFSDGNRQQPVGEPSQVFTSACPDRY